MLSLFRAEEGEEEADTRRHIGLDVLDERVIRASDATGSFTPQQAGRTNIPSTSPPEPQAAKSTGAPIIQEPYGTVAMQVDVPPSASTEDEPSRFPPQPVGLKPPQPPTPFAYDQSTSRRTEQSPLPPPPDPLPSTSAAFGPTSMTASIPPATQTTFHAPTEDDDDDEPMPTIDLGSDSESE